MTFAELLTRFRDFQKALIEHRELWGRSLSTGGIEPGVYKNHAELEAQRRRLAGMLAVLNPYITRYAMGRTSAVYGQPYDIFLTAVLNDPVAFRKSYAFNEAIPLLDGVIAKLELQPPDERVSSGSATKRSCRAFISHGKHSHALDQIERFVRNLGLEPIIVKHQPSGGGAVDDQVPALMGSSDVAVIVATADDTVDDRRQPRGNVLHEIGLAQEMLKGRVIYLKEVGCSFPSNINPKIWEDFTQDDLAPAFMKIVKELKAFELI